MLLEPLCKTGSDLKSSPAFHNLGPTVEVRWGSVGGPVEPRPRKLLIGEVLLPYQEHCCAVSVEAGVKLHASVQTLNIHVQGLWDSLGSDWSFGSSRNENRMFTASKRLSSPV